MPSDGATGRFLRQAPRLTLALLAVPVLAGGLGTVMPAFSNGHQGLLALRDWPGLPQSVWLSLKTGLISTALALFIALLLIATLHGTRSFRAVQHMLAPLLSVPHAAAALGLAFLISPSGWIVRTVSPWATGWTVPPDVLILNDPGGWALILGLVAKEVPFLLLMSLAALPQTDASRRLAQAQSLGAGRVVAFCVAVLPDLYAQVRLPVFAVLAYAMTAVEMALILGPSLPPTLSVQIVEWMGDPRLTHRATAAAAALVQLGAVVLALIIWQSGEAFLGWLHVRLAEAGWRGKRFDGIARPLGLLAGVLLSGLLLAGLAGLSLWSFAGLWQFPHALPEGLTFRTWMRAGPDLIATAGITLAMAVLSTAVALALVLACLEAEARYGLRPGRAATSILYLPLIIPQIAFLPGLQGLALMTGIEGHWIAVAACHLVFVLPYVFLSLSAPYRAFDPRLATAGATLGADPDRVFWSLRLPILLRPVLTAFAVGMAVSIGQYLPTLLIGGGRVESVTTEAVALSSGGDRRLVGAYGLIQMILPALGFLIAIAVPAWAFRNRSGMRAAP